MAISANALIEKFQKALHDHWGYIWGTAGELWTEKKQLALEKTTDPNRAQGRKYGSKWINHVVADCSGLFSWAFSKLGGYMYHGSDTMYKKYCTNKGELKKGKRTDGKGMKPGTAVFVWNGEKYSHVGLFVGDNTVIEAMSTIKGVTTSKLTDSKWTHWGELKGIDYSESVPEKPKDDKDKGSEKKMPTLRRGSKGTAVKELQQLLVDKGYSVGSYGIDGDFGSATLNAVLQFQKDHGLNQDGVVGAKTWAALLNEEQPKETYMVTIRYLNESTAKEIVNKYGGTMMKEG